MSEGARLSHAEGMAIASDFMHQLRSEVRRIEIAGSLRRNKATVGDIELVCIPETYDHEDMFGNVIDVISGLDELVPQLGYPLIKNGSKFKQIDLGRVKCDLFITTPEQWGVIFLIRTGSADFSHRFVTPKRQGGYMPTGMQIQDGRLWRFGQAVETPEETDVFREVGLNYTPPTMREL